MRVGKLVTEVTSRKSQILHCRHKCHTGQDTEASSSQDQLSCQKNHQLHSIVTTQVSPVQIQI